MADTMDLFQGQPLPAVTKTTEKATAAPEFYTNYLQDIANLGQNAVSQGGVAGMSPLQQQALQMAPNMAFAGAGTMGSAAQAAQTGAGTTIPQVIGQYMNPYTKNVVDEMGRLAQRNIQENVMPALGAVGAGTGQFGSRRQLQIGGNTLRDLQADLLGKQYEALRSGYSEAGKMADLDLNRALAGGEILSDIGTAQQNLGLTGLKSIYDFGTKEQELGQRMLDYPMQQAKDYASLMRGFTLPVSEVTQTTGPEAGAYSQSPLAQIASFLLGLGSFMKNGGSVQRMAGGGTPRPQRRQAAYTDGRGNFYDENGYLVR